MHQRRHPLALFGVLMLALVVAIGMSAGAVDAKKKKKKKKKPTPVTQTTTVNKSGVNLAIPDQGPAATDKWGQASSTADIAVTGKAKFVTDVNLTIQTTGSAAGATTDLVARLKAPNGRTVQLFSNLGDATTQNIGPFKMDDDTETTICDSATPTTTCLDPDMTLIRPFAGTAQPPQGSLSTFNWAPMKGTWTLKLFDNDGGVPNTLSSTLNSWTLEVSGRSFPLKK
jgi:subtilisin-like proprotein convertase family protein